MSRKFGIIAVLLIVVGAVFGGIFGKLPLASSADTSLTPEKIVADYRLALDVIFVNYFECLAVIGNNFFRR